MKASRVQGQLLSFDAEKSEIQIMDRADDEIITLKISLDTFPSSINWNDYVGEEIGAIVVGDKTKTIFRIEEREIEISEQGNESEYKYILDRPEFKRQMKDLVWHIGGTMDYFNFRETGLMDFLTNNLYISWYYGAKEVHTTNDALDDDCFHHLPKEERRRITRFLEHCAENGIIVYWRDFSRFTWCVLDKDRYKRCCKKFGVKKGDFHWYSFAEMGMSHLSH